MIIEHGINPNCSELVIRLGDVSVQKVKDSLESIGIREYLMKDWYNPDKINIKSNWDEEDNKFIIAYKDVPDNIKRLFELLNNNDLSIEENEKIQKELKELGYNYLIDSVHLLDEHNIPSHNDDGSGIVWLNKNFDDSGVAIVGHQHCQPNMFPLLKKISDYYGIEVEADDGGDVGDYNDWLSENSL